MALYTNSNLSQLPAECLEYILRDLDRKSIQNLRLSNKVLSQKCLGPRFKSFVEEQATDLTRHSLRSLCALAAHELGRCVRSLTVIALVYDETAIQEILESGTKLNTSYRGHIVDSNWVDCSDEELVQAVLGLNWVRQKKEQQVQDSNLTVDLLTAAMTQFSHLQRLRLDAVGVSGPGVSMSMTALHRDVRKLSLQASQACHLVMEAVGQSGLTVDHLDLYRSTQHCGILAKDLAMLAETWQKDGPPPACASLQTFAVTIASDIDLDTRQDTITNEHNTAGDIRSTQAISNEEQPALAVLFTSMPRLKCLDLHIYQTGRDGSLALRGTLQSLAKRTHLQSLERCSISGIHIDEESLQHFLSRHSSVTELELAEIHLGDSGNWLAVLSSIKADFTSLHSLHLSNLWAARLFNLEPAWESAPLMENLRDWSLPCQGGLMVHTLELEGEDLKRDWNFERAPSGRALGSGQSARWHARTRDAYGPV